MTSILNKLILLGLLLLYCITDVEGKLLDVNIQGGIKNWVIEGGDAPDCIAYGGAKIGILNHKNLRLYFNADLWVGEDPNDNAVFRNPNTQQFITSQANDFHYIYSFYPSCEYNNAPIYLGVGIGLLGQTIVDRRQYDGAWHNFDVNNYNMLYVVGYGGVFLQIYKNIYLDVSYNLDIGPGGFMPSYKALISYRIKFHK